MKVFENEFTVCQNDTDTRAVKVLVCSNDAYHLKCVHRAFREHVVSHLGSVPHPILTARRCLLSWFE